MILAPVDEWVADPRTGKKYMVLETTTHDHDINQETCRNIGAHLPEPRDEQENLFLDSLGSDTFVLGITDEAVEGQWVFESDGSPLTWFSWMHYTHYPERPNSGRNGNCAVMTRRTEDHLSGHRSQDWNDFSCNSNPYLEELPKSLICQKYTGE